VAGIPKSTNAVIVTIFADSAAKYLNERFWDEEIVMADSTSLWISGRLAEKIRAHGAETYPHECCGALLGRDSNAVLESNREMAHSLLAARSWNFFRWSIGATIRRAIDFSVTAQDVLAAEKAARDHRLEVVGWYHSHPDHPARPSEYDRDHAWPWYSYIIVSVQNGAPQDMTPGV